MSNRFLTLLLATAAAGPLLGQPGYGMALSPASIAVNVAAERQPGATLNLQRGAAVALDVDYERSTLVARLQKGGLLRFLGHEHGVIPAEWSAVVRFDAQDLEGSSLVVEVSAPQLIIDTERARRLAGVDPDGPSDSEVEQIRAKMLSDEQLDAGAFPIVRFESIAVRLRSEDELRIEGTLTVHGVAHPVDVDASLEADGSGYVVRGSFEIKLRDFGIEPVSIGGVVKVANEVEILFEVFASRR